VQYLSVSTFASWKEGRDEGKNIAVLLMATHAQAYRRNSHRDKLANAEPPKHRKMYCVSDNLVEKILLLGTMQSLM
jgi:hypothetical protein